MMKNFFKSFFSMQLTVVLLLMFALSIGMATFIENDYGSVASKVAVYNATWFEVLLLVLAINLVGSLIVHKVWQRKKYTAFLMHISFVVILIGAAITRFIGYEGMMHIREGESSSVMLSDNTYITARWGNSGNESSVHQKVMLSGFGYQASPFKVDNAGEVLRIKTLAFIPNAVPMVKSMPGGEPVISLFALTNTERRSIILRKGEMEKLGEFFIGFDDLQGNKGVKLSIINDSLYFVSTDTIFQTSMGGRESEAIPANQPVLFTPMKFYDLGGNRLVLRAFELSGEIVPVQADVKEHGPGMDAVVVKASNNIKEKNIVLWGKRGMLGEEITVKDFGIENLRLSYGSRLIELPFSLHLNKFVLDRYPGSNSPSSYASEVTLKDTEKGISYDFRIFMNNILTHRGYRFYQSSYDQDEKGTILSVNHDAPGTTITYIGYALMTFTMIFMLIARKTRFRYLLKTISELRVQKSKIISAIALLVLIPFSQTSAQEVKVIGESQISVISESHANKFARLTVLGPDGRLEPLNTLSSELLRKVSGKSKFHGLNPDQVMLGMMIESHQWQHVPIFKIKNKELRKVLNISGSYASFTDFFEMNQNYKLGQYISEAFRKNPFDQSQFDKDVISVDEKVNVFYMMLTGNYLQVFPDINTPESKWYHAGATIENFPEADSNFVKNIFPVYIDVLGEAVKSNDYAKADELIDGIGIFQKKYAGHIIPAEKRQNMEIMYNRVEIFERLYKYFGMIGLIFLVLLFINLVNPKFRIGIASKAITGLLFVLFLMQTAGLAARWYIAGHAPMSNGYESMIYIGWATMLAGFIFVRKSSIALAATTVLASLTLFVAHLNWMNPEITNLVPVLKSVWLTIHVGVITASYGFLGLVMIMGIFNLLLMIFQNRKNYHSFQLTIKEITLTIELSMTIGLYMLTIGSFLGGVWANESWGRYWGWDPKETWSLVTILVYTVILHIGYVPGLKGRYLFNALSVIGFASVLMTYFGVNYYLSGLHSYAAGDPVPIPKFVYYSIAILFVILVVAWANSQKLKNLETASEEKE